MSFVVEILKSLWLNHRKKLVAFLLGLLLAGAAALTGIPLAELKEAARDAANAPSPAPMASPAVLPEAPKAK